MSTALFRGTVTAAAVIVDPVLLGTGPARRRVLALGGADLRLLPDGRWLALLPAPVELRTERAPGLVLVADRGGLAAPGLSGAPGTLAWPDGGEVRTAELAALPPVPTRDWLDLGGVTVHRLVPMDAPPPAELRPEERVRPDPDLRARARIGRPGRALTRLSRPRRRIAVPFRIGFLAVGYVLILLWVLPLVHGAVNRGVWAFFVALLLASVDRIPWLLREAGRLRPRTGRGVRRPGFLRRLLTRTAPGVLARQHERYLRTLTRKFQRREWDEALREAIGLGGSGGESWLRLRMPKPRQDLRLTSGAGGGAIAMTGTATAYLRALYEDAARALESAGRLDEAVFVHGELLGDTGAAIALLERQGRRHDAAQLAEARDRPAEEIVRLWWRAGDRDRAVAAARARNAFAAAIDRLTPVDRPAAVGLRRAWVGSRRRSGDPLGAIAAAWPEPELRAEVLPDIAAAMALGGPAAGTALAHLVAVSPSDRSVGLALDLLASRDAELRRARAALVDGLAAVRGPDQVADRRLCSAAVRSAYGLAPGSRLRATVKELTARADPLLAADLPPPPRAGPPDSIELTAPRTEGQLPVYDAVALPGRAILVACGDLGVRLLTTEGRTRARWDVPARQLVVADSGTTALLVRWAGAVCTLARLDLPTRKVTPGPVLRLQRILPSFDGGTAVVVDEDGIALLDVLADRPRVLWRELDARHRVLGLARTPDHLSALVLVPPLPGRDEYLVQLFTWELPSMTLRVRRNVEFGLDFDVAVVHDDTLSVLGADDDYSDPKITSISGYGPPHVVPAGPGSLIHADGAAFAVQRDFGGTAQVRVEIGDVTVQAEFPRPADNVRLREHAGLVTLFDGAGRIVAAEPGGAGDLAAFATTL